MNDARMAQELHLLRHRYPEIQFHPDQRVLLVPAHQLCPGWNSDHTAILLLVPPGYATIPPDNFLTDSTLLLANGAPPQHARSLQPFLGKHWRLFSFHLEPHTWRPTADVSQGHNLLTYFLGIEEHLQELVR